LDVSYQWLRYFEEDDVKLKEVYDSYKSGKLLSGELKAILIEKISTFLVEHQKKREEAKDRIDEFVYKA
jgi:tryptophanyl-tRNA synthetase